MSETFSFPVGPLAVLKISGEVVVNGNGDAESIQKRNVLVDQESGEEYSNEELEELVRGAMRNDRDIHLYVLPHEPLMHISVPLKYGYVLDMNNRSKLGSIEGGSLHKYTAEDSEKDVGDLENALRLAGPHTIKGCYADPERFGK